MTNKAVKHDQSDAVEANVPEVEKVVESAKEVKTPSWFAQDLTRAGGEALAERYRTARVESPKVIEPPDHDAHDAYKKSFDEKFKQAQQLYDNPIEQILTERRPTLPLSDIHGRRRLYEQEQRAHVVERRLDEKPKFDWRRLIGFSAMAMTVGGLGGFGFANADKIDAFYQSSVKTFQVAFADWSATLPQAPAPIEAKMAAAVNETVIQKKSIPMASLDVNDVRGNLNSMIPLMLSAQAAEGAAPVALKVMGLPRDAYLTAGIETTKGNWLLKPSDIAGVKLVVLQSTEPQFNMEIAAVEENTGVLAAPVKAMNVQLEGVAAAVPPPAPAIVTTDSKPELTLANVAATIAPVNAQPETAMIKASPIPAANPEATELISKADGLLNSGDIASARQFYLQADKLGDVHGAFGVGRSYDPQVFAALNVQGLKPDAAKAAIWYKKAADGGVAAAKNALSQLATAQP